MLMLMIVTRVLFLTYILLFLSLFAIVLLLHILLDNDALFSV